MAVKIKSFDKKPTSKRTCGVCGKSKQMERFQRFCSPVCKNMASDLDKHGTECKVVVGRR